MEKEKEKDSLYVEENHEHGGNGIEEGVKTPATKKKIKKKMSEEHESDLSSHSLVLALPATKKYEERNATAKKDRRKKKTGNAVENVVEGSVSVNKKKKKKVGSDATENVEVSKMELDEEFMQDLPFLVKPQPDSKMTKEMVLEENKIKKRRRKKKRNGSLESNDLDKNTMEVGLSAAANSNNEAISEHNKIKRKKKKKKKCLSSGSVDMDQKELEKAMWELMLKVKPASAVKIEEDHMEVDTEMNIMKRRKKEKKKRHDLLECTKMDTKPLEDNLQDLSVKEKPEAVQQVVENHEEVNTKQKKVKKKNKKQQLSSSENGDGNQSQLKTNLEKTVSNTPDNALLTSKNHEEMNATKKRKIKKKEHDGRHQKMLEEGSLELQLPVESDLKASLLVDENHASRMKDKSTVCKVKASDNASARDVSTKQLVEKSEVSSSELLREVKQCPTIGVKQCPTIGEENKEIYVTDCKKEKGLCSSSIGDAIKDFGFQDGNDKECISTQIILDLPKSAPVSCTRKKLLILDLNGLLLDVVMVVPRGYKAEKRIGQKSVFKRPFCDDFLNFCFERFEVGVWTSRTKRNMDDVIDFLMADTKHKLLFCWDQSHCTMTGINTIDNRHKPLVCKELRKLWDKHEPTLPWEKGEYNESNTLLLDDSPHKALLNPPNTAIFPHSYSLVDMDDKSLGPEGDIRLYLERLAAAEHVQEYVKQHPFGQHAITSESNSWGFYCRVFDRFKLQVD